MWAQICGIIAIIVHKMTSKKIIYKIGTSRGKIFALRNLRRNLHMFLDNIRLRIENNNYYLGKTDLQSWSQIDKKK